LVILMAVNHEAGFRPGYLDASRTEMLPRKD
jgi:hypothetical protein